jgi:hypothetical protein
MTLPFPVSLKYSSIASRVWSVSSNRAGLPVMRRQGSGKIIVIGSIEGLIGLPTILSAPAMRAPMTPHMPTPPTP